MREVLENCVEELKGYREEHGDYSHEIQGDYLYDAIKLVSTNTVQDYHNPADVEALRKAREALQYYADVKRWGTVNLQYVPTPEVAKKALAAIDKAIGGKEDE